MYKKFQYFLLVSILSGSFLYIYSNFPATDDYKMKADEGTYYRQGKTISKKGLKDLKPWLKDTSKIQRKQFLRTL
jgi:hypothetical protein